MDSNLRRSAILISVLIILTFVVVVILANSDKMQKKKPVESSVVISSVSEEKETDIKQPDINGFVQIGNDTSAWQKDSFFFDTTDTRYAALLYERMRTFSVKAVSVEKNLRIQILDYEGNPAKGFDFEVSITSNEWLVSRKFKDEDSDGRIELENLSPGNYEILLEPVENYIVPEKSLKITVKDSVEYLMIEDISFQIRSSQEISVATENRMEVSAKENAPKKQKNTYPKDDRTVYGIDLSEADGEIDWGKIYGAGIRFVMLRAGYRGAESGCIVADSNFYNNAKAAIRAGLDVGAYFYSQAITEVEAVEEASALMLMCSDINLSYPLTIRFDRAGGTSRADDLSSDTRNLIAEAFCETVKNSGYKPAIYVPSGWIDKNIDSKLFSKYNLWLADYEETPTYEGWFDMWQYSSDGKVPGVNKEAYLSLVYIQ